MTLCKKKQTMDTKGEEEDDDEEERDDEGSLKGNHRTR
jgi:hypothetical protein